VGDKNRAGGINKINTIIINTMAPRITILRLDRFRDILLMKSK
jgi:hypothetical protein